MSSNDNDTSEPNGTSSAIGVGFSSIADRYGASSSRAESSSSGKRSQRSEKGQKEPETPEGKHARRDEGGNSTGSFGHRSRNSGGFLLDSAFANGSPKSGAEFRGKRKAQDGQLRVDKRRHGPSRLSGESSQKNSPLSREVSMDVPNVEERDEQPASRAASMDPAQLVQMALDLSESRKRHVSNTLQVPLQPPRRAASGPVSNYGTVRASSSAPNRSSQLTDNFSRSSPSSDRSGGIDRSVEAVPVVDFGADNVLHTFSPATLSRAEKARKYFELASEHRRLLQHLPPLKPDSSAPGNYTVETVNRPGSAYPEITRIPSAANSKHALGRQYNPIQSLRNRRIRLLEKRPFPAPPETWQDPEKVKNWIDDVETATGDPSYRATDNRVHVPPYAGGDDTNTAHLQENTGRHRRTDTVSSVITRPENSWTIEPTELLADAYWTEQSDNKAYIESRRGTPIFPSMPRKSMDTPKISVEMHRGRAEEVDGGNASDEETSGRPSRRRRLMMPLKGPSERRKNRRHRSRSASSSSSSSTEGRMSRNLTADENIGPLERHMQELITKDENGELSSPETAATDHWDAKYMPYQRTSVDKSRQESLGRANGRASLEVPRDLHRRSKSADGRVGSADPAMSSTEDLTSEPVSPVVQRNVPSIGIDLSPPSDSRHSLDGQRSRGPKLPPSFRSSSKERNKIGQVDFADGAPSNLSPILSNDSWRPRSSQDTERPSEFKRHKTDESVSNSLHRLDTSSTTGTFTSIRDSGSTVGRLLKGGRDRLGGLVRGDGARFSDRFKNRDRLDGGGFSDVSANASDIEDDSRLNGSLKKRVADPDDYESDVSPRASLDRVRPKPKYHLSNLPSFTSSARDKRLQAETPMSTNSDPISRQQQAQREAGKSERFGRLAPPRIDLPEGSNAPETEAPFKFPSIQWNMPGKSYSELAAFGAAAATVGGFGMSKSPGQRHWSIYDQAQPVQADKISSRDVARVRTLLLCSGIKAREIQRLGNSPRQTPSTELSKAAETAGQTVEQVPLKEEHVVAARMLSSHLSSSLSDFEATISRFQNETAKDLASQLEELQHKAADHLTTLVHETSDEADTFTFELTTKRPHDTKRVDEAVDEMFKQRRRQFQILRKAGFKLLEWLVLSIMWWIWFLVVIFNTGKRIVIALLRFLRWLFVF